MVFLRTRKHFAKNYNKLKRNTSLIERNVRESVKTGLEILNNIEKDSKELYYNTTNNVNKNPYYRTARKYFRAKKNKSYRKSGGSGSKRTQVLTSDLLSTSQLEWDPGYIPSKK
jgi:hypothetical protein